MTVDDLAGWLDLGRSEFDRRLRLVGRNDWARTTPCSEWDVRQVANHVVGQEYRVAGLLAGGTLEDFIAVREDDFLCGDPPGAWERDCAMLDRVLSEPGVMERSVDYRNGPTTGRVVVTVRVFDMAVHCWDLARGVGLDEVIEPALVDWCLDALAGPLAFLNGGFPPAPADLVPDASAQDRLLHACGRSPK
jgi:uncharacterized protein (TIGR03086 family)